MYENLGSFSNVKLIITNGYCKTGSYLKIARVVILNPIVINLCSYNELLFLIGHEYGHHVLHHPKYTLYNNSDDRELICDKLAVTFMKHEDLTRKEIINATKIP